MKRSKNHNKLTRGDKPHIYYSHDFGGCMKLSSKPGIIYSPFYLKYMYLDIQRPAR